MENRTLTRLVPCAATATVFSSAAFCQTWSSATGIGWYAFGPERDLGCLFKRYTKLQLKSYVLSAAGLYWGSDIDGTDLQVEFAQLVLQLCHRWDCLSVKWSLRYDAQEQLKLITSVINEGDYQLERRYTHVLPILGKAFDEIYTQRIKNVTRQQVRYGAKAGIEVRRITSPHDLEQHYSLYQTWASSKNITLLPRQLFAEFAQTPNIPVAFLGAFYKNHLHAAIIVFQGEKEWFYWHSVRNPELDEYFAVDILLASALKDACENGVSYFNLGASQNIKSLEFFKERWGGEKRETWRIEWKNNTWLSVLKTGRSIANRVRR